jgi:hypothetical protein
MTFPVAESRSCRNGNSAVYVPEYDKMDKNLHSEEKFLSAVEILFLYGCRFGLSLLRSLRIRHKIRKLTLFLPSENRL